MLSVVLGLALAEAGGRKVIVMAPVSPPV